MTILPNGTKVELIGPGVVQVSARNGYTFITHLHNYMAMRRSVRHAEMAEQAGSN